MQPRKIWCVCNVLVLLLLSDLEQNLSMTVQRLDAVSMRSAEAPDHPPPSVSTFIHTGCPGRRRVHIGLTFFAFALDIHGPTGLANDLTPCSSRSICCCAQSRDISNFEIQIIQSLKHSHLSMREAALFHQVNQSLMIWEHLEFNSLYQEAFVFDRGVQQKFSGQAQRIFVRIHSNAVVINGVTREVYLLGDQLHLLLAEIELIPPHFREDDNIIEIDVKEFPNVFAECIVHDVSDLFDVWEDDIFVVSAFRSRPLPNRKQRLFTLRRSISAKVDSLVLVMESRTPGPFRRNRRSFVFIVVLRWGKKQCLKSLVKKLSRDRGLRRWFLQPDPRAMTSAPFVSPTRKSGSGAFRHPRYSEWCQNEDRDERPLCRIEGGKMSKQWFQKRMDIVRARNPNADRESDGRIFQYGTHDI
ncbi:hypothetical protein SISNIDRAFT_469314 [Sistotremastrum niveocremeum HHB9708]|uniref:Uncharacterized protein n=1 Tax=Sistotremastrum niveocremeum HHB9708 TaxID=1314777 RepID=A0A164QDD5_9AGAM|nr:hypothetical protein SISNIDRAFT_469314 [Sistotremastrum niveocremeum HHB9708]